MSEQLEQSSEPIKKSLSNREVLAYLAEKFPLCFFLEGEVKPLKIGLFQELAEALADDPTVSKTSLRAALRTYTLNWRYLAACQTEGAVRVGLQGEEAGVVDAAQAAHAAQSLEESRAAYAEFKAKQRKEAAKEARKSAKPRGKKPSLPKASAESLNALKDKFSKDK